MDPDRINEYRIRELIDKLNYHTKLYDAGKPEISDRAWDQLYFLLVDCLQEAFLTTLAYQR